MYKDRTSLFSIVLLLLYLSQAVNGFPKCNCDDDNSWWRTEKILEYQRVADFVIAFAYLSIPIQLLYFISCFKIPFKWIIFQFIAFLVPCGITHLLSAWTYGHHHSFSLIVTVTVLKVLTALVSIATTISLITLIPLLLKVKGREFFLRRKTRDLGIEVGMMTKQNEAGKYVRMLTQEIRKSLDKDKILHTTLVELTKMLRLQNCVVWMPNADKTAMYLTHESNGWNVESSIPISDPDVVRVVEGDNVINMIDSESVLASASRGVSFAIGPVSAIRIPMLNFSDFEGEAQEITQACYAILVLVLPIGEARSWSIQEFEIINIVADQVSVALSHAAILEESQRVRDKLEEQNRALQQEKNNAVMANEARAAFQKVMSDGMGRPMHSTMGLLSMMQDENLKNDQKLIVDTMVRASGVMSNLMKDGMDDSVRDGESRNSFSLHNMLREAACISKCMSLSKGFGFNVEVDKYLPDYVIGNENRIFQVIMHMIRKLIDGNNEGGTLVFRVFEDLGSRGRNEEGYASGSSSSRYVHIRFEIGIYSSDSESDTSVSSGRLAGRTSTSDWPYEERLSFNICQMIIQSMHGTILSIPNARGYPQVMMFDLWFQLCCSIVDTIPEPGESSSESSDPNSLFRGLRVLLAEPDNDNRAVTQRFLQKLGCVVTSVSSGFECVSLVEHAGESLFEVVILELHLPDINGFKVASTIRKSKSRHWPIVVALTASSEEYLLEICLHFGFNGVIRKPILFEGFAAELRRIVKGK